MTCRYPSRSPRAWRLAQERSGYARGERGLPIERSNLYYLRAWERGRRDHEAALGRVANAR